MHYVYVYATEVSGYPGLKAWVSGNDPPTCHSLCLGNMERLALFRLSVLAVLLGVCHSWDQNELDLFDLVEEVGENFYDLLHVDQVESSMLLNSHRILYPPPMNTC